MIKEIDTIEENIKDERKRIIDTNAGPLYVYTGTVFLLLFMCGYIVGSTDNFYGQAFSIIVSILLVGLLYWFAKSVFNAIYYQTSLSNATKNKLDFDEIWKCMKEDLKI